MTKRKKRKAGGGVLRFIKTLIKLLIILSILVIIALLAVATLRDQPENFPWTPLDLNQPIGYFTGAKLAALNGDAPACQLLLTKAGARFEPLPPRGENQCIRDDNVRFTQLVDSGLSYDPAGSAPSCPVAAALYIWETQIVQFAAQDILGQRVKSIRHFGSYSCRKIAGGTRWSEHATGNAIDIAAFVMADGTTISLSGHWDSGGKEGEFLRAVRDGSCDLFATVLSPDYNAAHADHFHLDQANRGGVGYGLCR